MKIGFLGCGLIAEPMIRSLVKNHANCEIFVSRRTRETSEKLCSEFGNVNSGDNQWVLDQSEIVILSLLAKVAHTELPDLKFKQSQQVISVMADISLDEVNKLIAPAHNCCITVPLPFIDIGGCPLPVYPESSLLDLLFGQENIIITQQSEDAMGPHFGATALLSTLMEQLHITSKWLGQCSGSDEAAEIYMVGLVSGYLNVLEKDGKDRFLEVMKDLSTEGGLNAQLLTHNRNAGMMEILKEGLAGLEKRLAKN